MLMEITLQDYDAMFIYHIQTLLASKLYFIPFSTSFDATKPSDECVEIHLLLKLCLSGGILCKIENIDRLTLKCTVNGVK